MSALFIAAIHNGELPNSPAAETLGHLREASPDSTVVEIVEQPPISDSPDQVELIRWGQRQWSLEARWRDHLGRRSPLREALARLGFALWKSRLRFSAAFRSRSWHVRQIEAVVSAKHQRAWARFLQSDASTAVIIESDATWVTDSDAWLNKLTQALPAATPAYVNLAGGLSARRLAIRAPIHTTNGSAPEGVRTFQPAVTNTSCAYLINRPMAELLLAYAQSQPADQVLGIDWLINAAFMWAHASNQSITCWHSDPAALTHGSLAGITQSWHPAR